MIIRFNYPKQFITTMKSSLFCRRYRITTITLRTSSATAIDQSHATHRIFRHMLRQKRWLWTVCRPVCHDFHSFSRDLASSPDLNFCFALTKTKATFSENFPKPDQYDREAYRPKQGIMIYVEITNRTISSVLNFLEAEATFVESESWF